MYVGVQPKNLTQLHKVVGFTEHCFKDDLHTHCIMEIPFNFHFSSFIHANFTKSV